MSAYQPVQDLVDVYGLEHPAALAGLGHLRRWPARPRDANRLPRAVQVLRERIRLPRLTCSSRGRPPASSSSLGTPQRPARTARCLLAVASRHGQPATYGPDRRPAIHASLSRWSVDEAAELATIAAAYAPTESVNAQKPSCLPPHPAPHPGPGGEAATRPRRRRPSPGRHARRPALPICSCACRKCSWPRDHPHEPPPSWNTRSTSTRRKGNVVAAAHARRPRLRSSFPADRQRPLNRHLVLYSWRRINSPVAKAGRCPTLAGVGRARRCARHGLRPRDNARPAVRLSSARARSVTAHTGGQIIAGATSAHFAGADYRSATEFPIWCLPAPTRGRLTRDHPLRTTRSESPGFGSRTINSAGACGVVLGRARHTRQASDFRRSHQTSAAQNSAS